MCFVSLTYLIRHGCFTYVYRLGFHQDRGLTYTKSFQQDMVTMVTHKETVHVDAVAHDDINKLIGCAVLSK